MPLECFKSLNKIQTESKTSNGVHKEKFKMLYREVYNDPRQERKYKSNLHGESHNTELLSESLPEHRNLVGDKKVEIEKSNTQKNKHKTHKRIHDSHSSPYKMPSLPKNEKKANPTLKREIPVKNRDFIVKKIPLNKEPLEFSIEPNQCPMVVRIHKGEPIKQKKKQGTEKSHSQTLTHSQSCPPFTVEKLKVTSENKTPQYKKKQQKSICRLMSCGYTISDLLNLSPRKSELDTSTIKKNSDTFTDVKKSSKSNSEKMLKNKYNLRNNSMNEKIQSCATDDIKDLKKKYPSNKKTIKRNTTSFRPKENCNEGHETSAHNIELENENISDDRNSPDLRNDQYSSNEYPLLKKPREYSCTMREDDLHLGCINQLYEDRAKQMKQTCLNEKASMTEKNQICYEKYIFKSHAEGKLSHEEYLNLENVPTKKVIVPENVVTLDASQSQFYKISQFLKNDTSKCSQNTNSEQLSLSSSTLNNSFIIDDQDCIVNTKSKNDLNRSYEKRRKVRSEEKNLNKYTDMNYFNQASNNKPCGSFLNASRNNSSLPCLNECRHKTPLNLDSEKLKNNNSNSTPYFKCLGCSKSVCEDKNFAPYCSDCNLKAKLSKISNESTSTNPDSGLNNGLAPSTKALTTIPESDISINKKRVNVAIQTDSDLQNDSQEHKKIMVNSKITEIKNNPSHSSDNIFKVYSSMASQFKEIQEINNSNQKEYLTQNNNLHLQFHQNLCDREFKREIPAKEVGSNFSEGNNLFLTHHELTEPFYTMDHLRWPIFNSMEPNMHSYRATIGNHNLQNENLIPNENSPLEYKTKASVTPFVSPIFPEKEYYRITRKKHNPCLAKKTTNETLKSKSAMNKSLDCSLGNMQKPSDINVQSRCRELSDCCVQSKAASSNKDIKSIGGSYISYEKRIACDKEITNSNIFTYSPIVKSLKESNELLFYERETFIPQKKDKLPDLSFSVMNIRDSLLSLDKHLITLTNKCSKENYKTNTKHTFPRATKHQNLNYISPYQSLQIQNSTENFTDCHMIYSKTSIKDQKEQGFSTRSNTNKYCLNNDMFEERTIRNEGTNCLQEECSLNKEEQNNSFYKPFNISKLDLHAQFIPLGVTAEDVKRRESSDYGVPRNDTDSFKVSTTLMEEYEINKSVKGISQTNDMIKLHSFAYIYFNISVQGKEYESSDTEKSDKSQDSCQTGLVLMPERTADIHNEELNDIILGSKLKTQINSSLILREEINTHEFNILELKALSKLSKVVTGEGSDIQIHNSEEDNLEKKPLTYKVVTPSTKVNELNDSDIGGEINTPVSLEKILNSYLIDQHFQINGNQGEINNKALKKKINTKKSRGQRKRFIKITNIFLCGYMAQMSFFRFVGGLQSKVFSELRKAKFV